MPFISMSKNICAKWIYLQNVCGPKSYQAFCCCCSELVDPPALTSMILLWSTQNLRDLMVQIQRYCLLPLGVKSFCRSSVHRHQNLVPSQTFQRWKHSCGSATFTFQKDICDVSPGNIIRSKVPLLLLRKDFSQLCTCTRLWLSVLGP